MSAVPEPKLAPPGAGLPLPELWIGRILFKWKLLRGSREKADAEFRKERAHIAALVADCDEAAGGKRVLIARLRGLEDSSRNWSAWMTLEHLRIVNTQIAGVIRALGKGVVPPGQASTAAVKPPEGVTSAVVPEYEKSCDAVLAAATSVPDLKTKARFAHPWFGPLDAAGWHALAGMHLGIHRRQVESVLAGVRE